MKRLGNIWSNVTDIDNGITAIIEGTRFKRNQREVQKLFYSKEQVEKDKSLWHRIDTEKARIYAKRLCESLENKTWRHGTPKRRQQFCRNRASSKGKWRTLDIPNIDDHIIAHMVMNASMEAFTRGMHPHCCGSVPNRGIKHVNRTVKRWFTHDKACRYFVKLDIRKFFDNIDRDILINVLERKIKDENVLWVFKQIIDSAPIPCPVGYYTSPWLANLYLERFDWFVEQDLYKLRRGKRVKYVRHYLRYVDDILLVGTSKSDLRKAVYAIKSWLKNERGLELKDAWEIKAIGKHFCENGEWKLKPNTFWCDIGGYKFSKDSTVLRDGIYLATKRLAKRMWKRKFCTTHECASIVSRVGWAKHCNSNNFIEKYIDPYVNINEARRLIGNVAKIRKQRSNLPSLG